MKKTRFVLIIFSLTLVLGVSACSLSLAQDVTPPPGYQPPVYEEPEVLTGAFPASAPNPANGEVIYQEKCLPCHGDTGLGDGPESTGLPNEVARIGADSVANLASPLEWYSITLQGNIERFMPPFSGSLNDQDVWDVLAYVYTFSADEAKVAEGTQVYAETCAACHGADGSGVAPGAANLRDAEQMVLVSVDDIIQKVATGNGNPEHVFSTELDAAQQEAVAYYVRSLTFPLSGEAVAESTPEPTTEPTLEAGEEAGPTQEAGEDAEPTDAAPNEETKRIVGVVNNGSGGSLPEGLEVTLEVYENFQQVFTETTVVEEDGSYAFEDVAYFPEMIYITVVEMNGNFFPSEFHIGSESVEESGTIELPITIYDATTDTSNLAVSRLHVFFQFTEEGTVQVINQISISNRGNTMVAPEEDSEPVLNFTLPEGATNLIFETGTIGNPYIRTETGFADPTAVMPGENTYEGLYAYDLPVERRLDWSQPVDLPVEVAVVFIEGEDTRVESQTLVPSGSETLNEAVFQVYVGDNFAAGQEIDLEISGPQLGGGIPGFEGNLTTIILGVVGLALAGIGVYWFFRPRMDFYEDDYQFSGGEDDADDLLDAIAALDDSYEAGEIDEKIYLSRRKALKAKLKDFIE